MSDDRARTQGMAFGTENGADKPDMGDPDTVEELVRVMLGELVAIRKRYNEARADERGAASAASEAQHAATKLIRVWSLRLAASNPDYQQSITPEGQDAFLRDAGYPGDAPGAPVESLISDTAKRVVEAMAAHENGEIDDDKLKFEIDTAVEDAVFGVMGISNDIDD